MKKVAENCGEVIISKKLIVDLESQVPDLTMREDDIHSQLEDQVENNTRTLEKNSAGEQES